MPKYGYREGPCACCGQVRFITGRRLCHQCNYRAKRDGTLDNWPRKYLAMTEIIEEMRHPARRGESFIEVARDLGLREPSAQRQYYRAREKGLVA